MNINKITTYQNKTNVNPSFKANVGFDQRIPEFLHKQITNIALYHGLDKMAAAAEANESGGIITGVLNIIMNKFSYLGTANDTLNFALTPEAIKYLSKQTQPGEKFVGADGLFFSESLMRTKGSPILKFTYESLMNPEHNIINKLFEAANFMINLSNK